MTSAKRARSSAVMNHIDVCTSLMWWEANALFFSDLPPKTHNPSPIMRKSSDKLHRETSYKITDQYSLKLSRSSKKQGKSEKLPENQGEPKETWQLNAVWCPRWGFGDRKRHWIKIEENLSRLWTNINNGKAMQARAQLCPALGSLMDCSPPASSVHGILQARILRWVAISSSRDLTDSGIEPVSTASPGLAGRFFTTEPPGKPRC